MLADDLRRLAEPAAQGPTHAGLLAALEGSDPKAARELVTDLLSIAGITTVGGRSAADIAERLRGRIRMEAVAASLPKGAVSVSIGIAAHRPGQSAAELMQLADRNLYAAKHGGRDAVVIDLKKYRAA